MLNKGKRESEGQLRQLEETIKKELDEQYFNRKLSREEIEANADEGWYGFVNKSR